MSMAAKHKPDSNPTERAALTRVALQERIYRPWFCLEHGLDLTEKTARVFHPHCPLIGNAGHFDTLSAIPEGILQ